MNRSGLPSRTALVLLILALAGCLPQGLPPGRASLPPPVDTPTPAVATALPTASPVLSPTPPPETDILPIRLAGPAAEPGAQFSGLAWAGDTLVLLPQYPRDVSAETGGALLGLPRAEILAYLDDPSGSPLTPREIALDSGGVEASIPGFEGFEAIAFAGRQAYLTVEASPGSQMKSYLVMGELSVDGSRLALDAGRVVEVPLAVQRHNFSNEAILIDGERVVLFYEANGAAVNPQPYAPVFDRDLNPLDPLALDPLEYRLTDATAPDEDGGRFWVSNYFFPGDLDIVPLSDPLAKRFGQGPSHAGASVVERLVELQLPRDGQDRITLTGEPPIQLRLAEGQVARNWEGLARLEGRGFLIVTDTFPETILAFVQYKGDE